jgi:hypothetical protein
MSQENCDYIVSSKNTKPQEVVNIPISLARSMQGKYFAGQTEALWVNNELNAWAGLTNPRNSDVNLFANVLTISNFSDEYLVAEIWLNTNFPRKSNVSGKVSPSNTALEPLPINEADIRFIKSTALLPENGVNVFERIVPPHTTLVSEEDGKFIEPPGGSYVVVIKSASSKLSKVIVAFGWWEDYDKSL